jgi:hypothetical protein
MPIPEHQFAEAVALAAPGRPFMCLPETYEGLRMLDGGQKPSLAEIEAAWAARPAKPLPPISVSMAALQLALGRDVCIQIGAYINGIQDADAKWRAQVWWSKSPRVSSDHPMVEHFRAAINKSHDQMRAWFEAAYVIDNP